jgi:xanthine/CO dehydrogenase XdhC/CoxF family maturation factor
LIEELSSEGVNIENTLSKIYSPVGLDIGAENPEEIALSIVSEVQAILSGRSLVHLRQLNSLMPSPKQ